MSQRPSGGADEGKIYCCCLESKHKTSVFQPAAHDVTRTELSHFLMLMQSWMQMNLATWHGQDKHLYRHRSDSCCRQQRLFFCCRVSFSYIFIPDCSRPPVDNAIYFHIFLMRISNIQNNYWHFLFLLFLRLLRSVFLLLFSCVSLPSSWQCRA